MLDKKDQCTNMLFMAPLWNRTYVPRDGCLEKERGILLVRRKQPVTDFTSITACGECCDNCSKKREGTCPGCIESDGRVPEWAESGRCRIHACAGDHGVQFCGLCEAFPCDDLPKMIPWNPDIIEHLTALRDEYRNANGADLSD